MKKLIITLPKYNLTHYILVNGENVKFKKNRTIKKFVAEYYSEDDVVEISTDTYNPYLRWHWWLLGMLFFIITIFGIFDSKDKNKYNNCYNARIGLNAPDNVVNLIPVKDKDKVFKVETTCEYTETINTKDFDSKIKKRRALLILTKVLFTIIVLGVLIAFALIIGMAALSQALS